MRKEIFRFDDFLSANVAIKNHLIIGDFNIHVDCSTVSQAVSFLSILRDYSLVQYVNEPTHVSGHILDLVLAHSNSNLVHNTSVFDLALSDHRFVHCSINVSTPSSGEVIESVTRSWKNFDLDVFRCAVESSILSSMSSLHHWSTENLCVSYNQTLSTQLDSLVSPTRRVIRQRNSSPWYNRDIVLAKRKRRQLEVQWRKTRSSEDRQAFVSQRNNVVTIVKRAKREFYSKCINDSVSPRALWSSLNFLLGRGRSAELPNFDCPSRCADAFSKFFVSKISFYRDGLPSMCIRDETPISSNATLSAFYPATVEEVLKCIRQMAPKTMKYDPIPTWLLKSAAPSLAPFLCYLVNTSLSEGFLPRSEKKAIVTPILKKSGLDVNALKNYRPVSCITFLSKLVERIVYNRLYFHIHRFSLLSHFQSAYRKGFSTETALVKIFNDFVVASDSGKLSFVVLLDLSAAFDMVDHVILFNRLAKHFGIRGTALSWLISFLSDRSFCVSVKSCFSYEADIIHGVPQGSVLGPLLFSLFVSPVW